MKLKLANLYNDNSLVLCNTFGNYLDSSTVRKRLKKIFLECGLEDRKFHDLRHTYATRLFELEEKPKTVQALLGHSDISVTLITDTHVLDGMKEKAVSKLDDMYKCNGAK
jgi:integrase